MSDINKKIDDLIKTFESMTDSEMKKFSEWLACQESPQEKWLRSIQTPQNDAMVENKTIVITDPCYVSDAEPEEWKNKYDPYLVKDTLYGDWSCRVYKGNKEELEHIINEWDAFYGDWWKRWNFETLTEGEKEKLRKELNEKEAEYKKRYSYGSFCADAGMVAVYDADKLPTKVIEELKKKSWCACFIENYSGPIRYVVEEHVYEDDGHKYYTAHIEGDGFYSSQSGF